MLKTSIKNGDRNPAKFLEKKGSLKRRTLYFLPTYELFRAFTIYSNIVQSIIVGQFFDSLLNS